jgi:hypothetical protein
MILSLALRVDFENSWSIWHGLVAEVRQLSAPHAAHVGRAVGFGLVWWGSVSVRTSLFHPITAASVKDASILLHLYLAVCLQRLLQYGPHPWCTSRLSYPPGCTFSTATINFLASCIQCLLGEYTL